MTPHKGAAKRLGRHYTPTGAVGQTKIVSLHTDKDGLVIVENESADAQVVPPGNLTVAVAVEAVPSHCGFGGGELVAGWSALRAWGAAAVGGPDPGDLSPGRGSVWRALPHRRELHSP